MEETTVGQEDFPQERRWNWGAFFLMWIWGIFNASPITLISLVPLLAVPIVGVSALFSTLSSGSEPAVATPLLYGLNVISLLLAIWFGKKGSQWAWRNKRWRDKEHFIRVQRNWAIAGWVIAIVALLLYLLAHLGPALFNTSGVNTTSEINFGDSAEGAAECLPGVSFKINGIEQC